MTATILCIADEPAVGAILERTLTRAGHRVVLADPHTLILDEATAQLAPRTARRTEP